MYATANYLIFSVSTNAEPKGFIQMENLYTGIDATLRLSSTGSLINTYISEKHHMLYTLHDNGTLLYWNADTLSLENSYNYAVGRRIRVSDYAEEHDLLCFASTPQHGSMYSSQCTLTRVFLPTGFVYLVICQPVTYWGVNYYEIIVSYAITEDQTLIPDRVTYVPSLELKGTTPAVCYTMLDSWGFSLVKALDPDTNTTIIAKRQKFHFIHTLIAPHNLIAVKKAKHLYSLSNSQPNNTKL